MNVYTAVGMFTTDQEHDNKLLRKQYQIKSVKIQTMECAENSSGGRRSVAGGRTRVRRPTVAFCNCFVKASENGTCILCPIGGTYMSCAFQNTDNKKPTSPRFLTCSLSFRNFVLFAVTISFGLTNASSQQ